MTTTKDKLSASVRMAKAAQQTGSDQPASQPAAKPAAKPAAGKTPAAKAAPAKPAASAAAGEITESGSTLFPARVWPD
jgi:hypothetical protein